MPALAILAVTLSTGMALIRATMGSPAPLVTPVEAAPRIAPGVWALLEEGCTAPLSLDLATWEACAQPFGVIDDELALLEKPEHNNKAQRTGGLYSVARTHFATAPEGPQSEPALLQVEVSGLGGKSFLYLVLSPLERDAADRVTAARAWPVACPAAPAEGVTRRGDRCAASTLAAVRTAAAASAMAGPFSYSLRLVAPGDAPPAATALPSVPAPDPASRPMDAPG